MVHKVSKIRYSEDEAARKLGLSVEQLRRLVKDHLTSGEDVPAVDSFQPSDLVMLRVLAGQYNLVTH